MNMLLTLRAALHTMSQARAITLTHLLSLRANFGVTEPRDRISAVLSMTMNSDRDVNSSTASRMCYDITPDYSKSIEQVYTEAMKAVSVKDQSLDLLGLAPPRRQFGEGEDIKINDLPSWVPNFHFQNPELHSFSTPGLYTAFSAAGDTDVTAAWPLDNYPNIMTTPTCCVDEIFVAAKQKCGDHATPYLLEWSRFVAEKLGPTYVNGESTLAAFIKTCTAGSLLEPEELRYTGFVQTFVNQLKDQDEDVYKTTQAHLVERILELGDDIREIDSRMRTEMGKEPTSVRSDNETLLIATQISGALTEVLTKNRKLYVTKNGYLGIGPDPSQEGDRIYLISGAKVPFVLRRVEDPPESVGDDLFNLIRESYVHGIMGGELVRDEKRSWNEISIV